MVHFIKRLGLLIFFVFKRSKHGYQFFPSKASLIDTLKQKGAYLSFYFHGIFCWKIWCHFVWSLLMIGCCLGFKKSFWLSYVKTLPKIFIPCFACFIFLYEICFFDSNHKYVTFTRDRFKKFLVYRLNSLKKSI